MRTLAVNVVGAVITVIAFLSGNIGIGLILALFFGIVAIRLANRERKKVG